MHFDSHGRDARATASLRHLPDEFIRVGNGGVHVIDEPRDIGLNLGGLAAERGDGLSVQSVFQRENVIVQLVQLSSSSAEGIPRSNSKGRILSTHRHYELLKGSPA